MSLCAIPVDSAKVHRCTHDPHTTSRNVWPSKRRVIESLLFEKQYQFTYVQEVGKADPACLQEHSREPRHLLIDPLLTKEAMCF